MNLKKICKKNLCILLCISLLTTFTYTTYSQVKVAKAAVVVDDLAIMLMLLAAAGCTYFGTVATKELEQNDIDNWDWGDIRDKGWFNYPTDEEKKNAEDALGRLWNDPLEDWLQSDEAKEKGWYKDEEFGWKNSNWQDDEPPEDPNENPTWENIKKWVSENGGKLKIAAGSVLAGVLGKFGYDAYEKQQKGEYIDDLQTLMENDSFPSQRNEELSKNYPWYVIDFSASSFTINRFQYPIALCKNTSLMNGYWIYSNYQSSYYRYVSGSSLDFKSYPSYTKMGYQIPEGSTLSTNVPIFDTEQQCQDYLNAIDSSSISPQKNYPAILNPFTLPFSTAQKKYIDDNPDEKKLPVSGEVTAPSLDDLKQLLKDYQNANNSTDDDPDERKNYVVNNFIQRLTTPTVTPEPTATPEPTSAPEPTTSPSPSEAPDPTTSPSPSEAPDPTTSPSPSEAPEPTSAPDPTTSPSPSEAPDPTTTPDPDTEPEDLDEKTKQKFLLPESIKRKFPFCIPFDLVDCFRSLEGSRKAPCIEWRLYSEEYGIDYTFVIDLSQFDSAAELCRTLFLLLFIVSLVLATRTLIRG